MDRTTIPDEFPIAGNVLVWNTSSETENNDSQDTPELDWQSRRRTTSFSASSLAKHPLLAKLQEMEENVGDIKHSDYMVHVLIQKQIRDYAYAVEDVIELLRNGSDKVLDNVAYWRGEEEHEDAGNDDDDENTKSSAEKANKPSWMSFTFTTKNGNQLDISQIGKNVVQMSETLKKVQENQKDALVFWTSEQKEIIFKLLVNLSQDLVKFRRKLNRIKNILGEKVKNLRRAAIQCECEISGNIVPTEIYYEWVKEDAEMYKERLNNSTNFSSEIIITPKPKIRVGSIIMKTARNLLSCINSNSFTSETSKQGSEISSPDSVSINSIITYDHMSSSVRVYEIKKDIEFILKAREEMFPEDDGSVCDPSIESFVANAKQKPRDAGPPGPSRRGTALDGSRLSCDKHEAAVELDEVWAAKPSKKYLDAIAVNITPKQKFPTPHYVYDLVESKIMEAFNADKILTYTTSGQEETTGAEEDTPATSNSNKLPPLVSTASSSPSSLNGDDSNAADFPLLSKVDDDETEIVEEISPIPQKLFNEEMMKHITITKQIIGGIHNIVTEAMWAIRKVEMFWLNPPKNMSKEPRIVSSTKTIPGRPKEIYRLLDFIAETAKLTTSNSFASRIYPEDKDEIVSVLDPVLKELTTCYMNFYVLHNLVMVDGKYLQELVSGFPRGNLVMRDWVSDPSIDEELQSIEIDHHGPLIKDFNVDVEDLFA